MLLLWARDEARLEAVAHACRVAGATATTRSLDLVDSAAALAALAEEKAAGPIDIAVLAAGLGDIQAPDERVEDPGRVARLGMVNYVTPSAMAAALADAMATRGGGHIILIGSAAGFHALPFATAYAGSKAGLARFAQALRIAMAPHGVHVLLASPGFIDTPGGRQVPGPRLLLMQPDVVAARIARASARGCGHLVLPWPFALLWLVDRVMPSRWRNRLLRSLHPPAPSP